MRYAIKVGVAGGKSYEDSQARVNLTNSNVGCSGIYRSRTTYLSGI